MPARSNTLSFFIVNPHFPHDFSQVKNGALREGAVFCPDLCKRGPV
ncbi:hypothetical protein K070079E91_05120 [Eisenbergiella porci]